MFFFRLPFQRWRVLYHVLAAVVFLGLVVMTGWWYLQTSQSRLDALHTETKLLQNQLENANFALVPQLSSDFGQTLPSITTSDDVARDFGRFAQTLGVQITSLSVERRPASAGELSKVQFNVVAQAEYRASKAWLAQLLSRYPSLSIQSLSLRGAANDASRQDVRATFLLFAKE